ncbi:hypothetical protein HDV00_004327 [Rhizophlyctis rosea]|nr:hypothetical protein HDV00_004327 [Rhizophlyctis rosea]
MQYTPPATEFPSSRKPRIDIRRDTTILHQFISEKFPELRADEQAMRNPSIQQLIPIIDKLEAAKEEMKAEQLRAAAGRAANIATEAEPQSPVVEDMLVNGSYPGSGGSSGDGSATAGRKSSVTRRTSDASINSTISPDNRPRSASGMSASRTWRGNRPVSFTIGIGTKEKEGSSGPTTPSQIKDFVSKLGSSVSYSPMQQQQQEQSYRDGLLSNAIAAVDDVEFGTVGHMRPAEGEPEVGRGPVDKKLRDRTTSASSLRSLHKAISGSLHASTPPPDLAGSSSGSMQMGELSPHPPDSDPSTPKIGKKSGNPFFRNKMGATIKSLLGGKSEHGEAKKKTSITDIRTATDIGDDSKSRERLWRTMGRKGSKDATGTTPATRSSPFGLEIQAAGSRAGSIAEMTELTPRARAPSLPVDDEDPTFGRGAGGIAMSMPTKSFMSRGF